MNKKKQFVKFFRPCFRQVHSICHIFTLLPLMVITLTFFPLISGTLYATDLQDNLLDKDTDIPWHFKADEMNFDQKTNQYIAKGNVVISKKNKKLTADFVRLDQKTNDAVAIGKVMMIVGDDVLTGDRMEINLETETGVVYSGTIFFKENHFYIKGDKIKKIGKNSYSGDNVSITTCDGESPDWKVTAQHLEVTIEGYGKASHAALWAKKMPVLYSPYLVFPVKRKRQTGFLTPGFGYSDRKGLEYIQPFFWAINDWSDATFYSRYMAERGLMGGTEYRYLATEDSKGMMTFNFLNDDKVDDETENSNHDWGYTEDEELRPNSERYWLTAKADQELPYDFTAKLDLDIVSDQDYLYEFRDGFMGFKKHNGYYYDEFGRDLDEYDDTTRKNMLTINKTWSDYSLYGKAKWYDDIIQRRWKDSNDTLQSLPLLGFEASKQRLMKSAFFWELESTYNNFYREKGTTGQRADIYPRVSLPFKIKRFVTIEPSVAVRGTFWQVGEWDEEDEDVNEDEDEDVKEIVERDDFFSRGLYDVGLDISSELYRVIDFKKFNIEKIKHIIRPNIYYEFTPEEENQEDYPNFDDIDRIDKESEITYSITNTFISKSKADLGGGGPAVEDDDIPIYTYHQFLRFLIEQEYDFNEANKDDGEPFGPISFEVEFEPNDYLAFETDAGWSVYDSKFESYNFLTKLSDKRNDRLEFEYRFTDNGDGEDVVDDQYINLELLVNITNALSVYVDYEAELEDEEDIETRLGMIYRSQCWSVSFGHIDQPEDSIFTFMVNLYGLGEFGANF
ncbi:LPS assembly protein LptD [Desulfococcaceae bacterium HSG9]|nr:LPS assembly protein LptD [Desulfococcaceae bacterium HSG9]